MDLPTTASTPSLLDVNSFTIAAFVSRLTEGDDVRVTDADCLNLPRDHDFDRSWVGSPNDQRCGFLDIATAGGYEQRRHAGSLDFLFETS